MSLFATDEENAYYDGHSKGFKDGCRKTLDDLGKWMEHDEGMIPVGSIREKIRAMKEEL